MDTATSTGKAMIGTVREEGRRRRARLPLKLMNGTCSIPEVQEESFEQLELRLRLPMVVAMSRERPSHMQAQAGTRLEQ